MSQMWDIPRARTAIRAFPEDVRRELGKVIFDLQKGGSAGFIRRGPVRPR
jgi:hypothetical protein